MVRTGVVDIVENALPLAEIAQHLRGGFARSAVQQLVRFFAAAGRFVSASRRCQHEFLVLEQQHSNDSDLDRVAQASVLVNQ